MSRSVSFRHNSQSEGTNLLEDFLDDLPEVIQQGIIVVIGGVGVLSLVAAVVMGIVSGFWVAVGCAMLGFVAVFGLVLAVGVFGCILKFFAVVAGKGSGGGTSGAGWGCIFFLLICAVAISEVTHWGSWQSLEAAIGVIIFLVAAIAGIRSVLKKKRNLISMAASSKR